MNDPTAASSSSSTSGTSDGGTSSGSAAPSTGADDSGGTSEGQTSSDSGEPVDDPPVCGNGIIENGEECDDANDDNLDVCTNACRQRVCGDGLVQLGELCDDGNDVNDDACTNLCTLPSCGDGFLQPSEQCDDGNFDDADGCSNACVEGICGVGPLDRSGICGIEATKRYDPTVFEEAERILPRAVRLELPAQLEVVVGNAGNHTARLSWSVGDEATTHCCYRGGASVSHPSTPGQIEAGLFYQLESCSSQIELGASTCDDGELLLTGASPIEAERVVLSVQHGDTFVPRDDPRTTARAELVEIR